MSSFAFFGANSTQEVCELLEQHGSRAVLLAGGTDLLVKLRNGSISPEIVIGLGNIKALHAIEVLPDGGVKIGAAVALTDIARHAYIQEQYTAVSEAALTVGSVQIQNIATMAGNVCNASPAADTVPPLVVYDARVVLTSRGGKREIPVTEFITGPGETVLNNDEFVEYLVLPPAPPESFSCYFKLGRTNGVDLALVSAACLGCGDRGDGLVRFSYGSVTPKPNSEAVENRSFTAAEGIILDRIRKHLDPVSDIRASRGYRLAMAEVLTKRAFAKINREVGGLE